MMLMVTHELVDGRVVAAQARELVPLDADMLATFHVRKGRFHVSQEVVAASDGDELDDEATPLARAIMAALDRAGVAGRHVKLSYIRDDTGRLYTWRIISTWIREAPAPIEGGRRRWDGTPF